MADTAIESANKIFKYLQDSDTIMKSSVNRIETIESTLSIPSSTSTSFSNTVKTANKTYTISKVYDLNNKTVTLPANVVLVFKVGGGLKNGTIIGTNSVIEASHKIFSNVNVQGTWKCVGNVLWFADGCNIVENNGVCYVQNKVDASADIQYALDSAFRELVFPPVPYYIANTIVLHKEKKLVLQGSKMKLAMEQCSPTIKDTAILFTDKNICILSISLNECTYQNTVIIEGGNFDTSSCSSYTSNCIQVLADASQKIWGLIINTNIKGKFNNTGGVGININPIAKQTSEYAGTNKAYVTEIRINSTISDFGIGVKATNYMNESTGTYYNWCTDIVIDGSIVNCPLCVDTNADCDIKAMLQAGYYWNTKQNGQALVRFSGIRGSMSSNIYDICGGGGPYSQQYALETTHASCKMVPYGMFNSFLIEARWTGQPVIKGILYNNKTEQINSSVA